MDPRKLGITIKHTKFFGPNQLSYITEHNVSFSRVKVFIFFLSYINPLDFLPIFMVLFIYGIMDNYPIIKTFSRWQYLVCIIHVVYGFNDPTRALIVVVGLIIFFLHINYNNVDFFFVEDNNEDFVDKKTWKFPILAKFIFL